MAYYLKKIFSVEKNYTFWIALSCLWDLLKLAWDYINWWYLWRSKLGRSCSLVYLTYYFWVQKKYVQGVISNQSTYKDVSRFLFDPFPQFLPANTPPKKWPNGYTLLSPVKIWITTSMTWRSVLRFSTKLVFCRYIKLRLYGCKS